ncbi:hypothetical protein BH23ACT2_BH23ACT2_20840 [soil metagenome]
MATAPQTATDDPEGPDRERHRHTVRVAYSPAEAAAEAGVSRSHIYSEMAAGRLRSRHAGRRRLILGQDLADWLDSLPA